MGNSSTKTKNDLDYATADDWKGDKAEGSVSSKVAEETSKLPPLEISAAEVRQAFIPPTYSSAASI